MDRSRIPEQYIERYKKLQYQEQIRLLALLAGKQPMWALGPEAEQLRKEIMGIRGDL